MAYSIEFTPVADKDLDNLSHLLVKRILKRIQKVCTDPRTHRQAIKSGSSLFRVGG